MKDVNEYDGYSENGGTPDHVNDKGELETGFAYHLSMSVSKFKCPVCTKEQDTDDYPKFVKSNLPMVSVKCNGCKRPIQIFSCPLTGKLTISEI